MSAISDLYDSFHGVVLPYAGLVAPKGFLLCNGQAVSRTEYAALFAAITTQFSGNTTSGSPVVSVSGSSTALLVAGMRVSGPGIPAGATLISANANSITLSQPVSETNAGITIVVAPHGVGDGSTTFNVPDLRGQFIRGLDGGRGVDPARALGSLQAGALQSHGHTGSTAAAGSHGHTGAAAAGGSHAHTASADSQGSHTHSVSGTAAAAGDHAHSDGYVHGGFREGGGAALNMQHNGPSGTLTPNSTGAAGAHTHSVSGTAAAAGAHAHNITVNAATAHTHSVTVDAAGSHTHTVTVAASGDEETRPTNVALNYIIKT